MQASKVRVGTTYKAALYGSTGDTDYVPEPANVGTVLCLEHTDQRRSGAKLLRFRVLELPARAELREEWVRRIGDVGAEPLLTAAHAVGLAEDYDAHHAERAASDASYERLMQRARTIARADAAALQARLDAAGIVGTVSVSNMTQDGGYELSTTIVDDLTRAQTEALIAHAG